MKAIYSRHVHYKDGTEYVRSIILADDTPASLEITGADVDGVNDDAVFAAGTVIIAPAANYICFDDGEAFAEKE